MDQYPAAAFERTGSDGEGREAFGMMVPPSTFVRTGISREKGPQVKIKRLRVRIKGNDARQPAPQPVKTYVEAPWRGGGLSQEKLHPLRQTATDPSPQPPPTRGGGVMVPSELRSAPLRQRRSEARDPGPDRLGLRLQRGAVDDQPAGDRRDHLGFHQAVRLQG